MIARTRVSGVILAVAIATALAACASEPRLQGTPPEGGVVNGIVPVELDVFSGRENPTWIATGDEARHLLDAVAFSGVPGEAATPPSVLGFRGFVLTGDDLPGGDDVAAIRIVQGGFYVEYIEAGARFVESETAYSVVREIGAGRVDSALWTELVESGEI